MVKHIKQGYLISNGGLSTKRLPLEGKLSLKATDEVSPKQIGSYFNRKRSDFKDFLYFSPIRELLFRNGDTSSVTFNRPSRFACRVRSANL